MPEDAKLPTRRGAAAHGRRVGRRDLPRPERAGAAGPAPEAVPEEDLDERRRAPGGAVFALGLFASLLLACAQSAPRPASFTIAVLPDTQNMIDYRHQSEQGFAFDASALFLGQMEFLAQNAATKGGDIAFVTAVGDVWQHQSLPIDAEHAVRGFESIPNPWFAVEIEFTPETKRVELPTAREGYAQLADAGVPFAVAPGNHDYDAMWSDARWPPVKDPREIEFTAEKLGMLHIGGLDNFRSVFGADSELFAGRDWYVASHRGGASSAQRFDAGGYRFLHVALEMSPDDDSLAWAASVIERHPGLPTIVTTHDYLDARGERRANPIVDLAAADPLHNDAEALWEELISRHDQIFLVLCGHHHGQAVRVDRNRAGHEVHQVLADYQDRGRAGIDAGVPLVRGEPVGIGDGWLRLMRFSLGDETPTIVVRTYSPHYRSDARSLPDYATWYKAHEAPAMSDAEFVAQDYFTIRLTDFRSRFGPPSAERAR